jgi:putative addiction module killer protein
MNPPLPWDVIPYETPAGEKPYEIWFEDLAKKDFKTAAIVFKRIGRLKVGHLGDCDNVGEGVIELRHHKNPGFRIYISRVGSRVYLLLVGGVKGRQQRDIEKAIEYMREYRGRK